MARKTPTTPSGSKLLGAELRRLRGQRTLDEIAAATRTPPLSLHVQPVAGSTLSDIELGIVMPSLSNLHALSLAYRTSMDRLMAFVAEESLTRDELRVTDDLPCTPERFAELLGRGAWHEAHAVALRLEQEASHERESLRWRGNRATCLSLLGQRDQATAILTKCLESPIASPHQRFVITHLLAMAHMLEGNINMALILIEQALSCPPEDITASELHDAHAMRIDLKIEREESCGAPDPARVGALLRLAQELVPDATSDPSSHLRRKLRVARAHVLLGQHALAQGVLADLIPECQLLGFSRIESRATLLLGTVHEMEGRRAQAELHYLRAASLADACQATDVEFYSSLGLFKLLRNDKPVKAGIHFKRCRLLAPLLPQGTPNMREFEELRRALEQ